MRPFTGSAEYLRALAGARAALLRRQDHPAVGFPGRSGRLSGLRGGARQAHRQQRREGRPPSAGFARNPVVSGQASEVSVRTAGDQEYLRLGEHGS